jgi:D-alanyl-D-alanine endopeptidase (penicillin-binding protein 7)
MEMRRVKLSPSVAYLVSGASVLAAMLVVSAGTAESAARTVKRTARTRAAAATATPAIDRAYSTQRALSRRSKLAGVRAAATAREMSDTVVPRYKVDAGGDLVPDLRAAAAVIYNPDTNEVLWEENSQDQRSIASITKVMTAVVFLETNPDLTQDMKIARSDVFHASTTRLLGSDVVTGDDLLHLLLIASDNAAARALARVSTYGADGFIARMNSKAQELGLTSTHYADPSGLLSDNVSSALDMARLIAFASADERISSIMRTPEYTISSRRRQITFRSTNHLLRREQFDIRAGKTGFISRAGYCLATLLRLPEGGQRFAVVVLGARSNAARFMETQNLFNWVISKSPSLFATATAATPAE